MKTVITCMKGRQEFVDKLLTIFRMAVTARFCIGLYVSLLVLYYGDGLGDDTSVQPQGKGH